MRVLVPEPEHPGHYLQWLAYVVEAFRVRGDEVIVVTSQLARQSPEWTEYMGELETAVECVVIPYMGHTPQRWRSRLKRWRYAAALAAAVRRLQPDLVFIPFLDTLVLPLLWRELTRPPCLAVPAIEGILVCVEDAYPQGDSLKTRLVAWARRRLMESGRLRRVLFVDELALAHVQQRPVPGVCLEHCPQPVVFPPANGRALRQQFDLGPEVVVVASFGMQDERKGVDRLLQAFMRRPPRARERLLLAGRHSPRVRQLLADYRSADSQAVWRVLSLDRFLRVEEFRAGFAAADVVAAIHPHQIGTSDTLMYAAAFERPVLASKFGWIGHFARTHQLGYVCDTESPDDLARGLDWAFSRPPANIAVTREVLSRYTPANFGRVVRGEA